MSDRPLEFIFGVNDNNPLDVTWGPYMYAGLDYRPARKRVDLISAEDADGAVPLGPARADNMLMALRLRIDEGADMDAALDQMHRLQKKLDDATRRGADGLECAWRPEGASERSYFYLLEGEIAEAPQEMSGADIGWYHKSPIVVVTMICKPFFYGDTATSVATVTGASTVLEVDIANVGGDVDAEGVMSIENQMGTNRWARTFEWGLEQSDYDPAAPTPVVHSLDDGSLTVAGYEGTSSTLGGSRSTNVVQATIAPVPVKLCAIDETPSQGTKKIIARVYPGDGAEDGGVYLRLAHRSGAGAISRTEWKATPQPSREFQEVDLGVVHIGSSSDWEGVVEAYTDASTSLIRVDYVEVLPAERYGKATSPIRIDTADSFVAYDTFDQSAGPLDGDTPTIGPAWVRSGDSTDYQISGTGIVTRTATSDSAGLNNGCFAMAGTTVLTNTGIAVDFEVSALVANHVLGFATRYDATNDCMIFRTHPATGSVVLETAGGSLIGVFFGEPLEIDTRYTIAFLAFATGLWAGWLQRAGTSFGKPLMVGRYSQFATGGTYEDGAAGIFDHHPGGTALTRTFDNFRLWEPTVIPGVCAPSQDMLITHDAADLYDAAGANLAPVPRYRGSRFFIPPSGDQSKTTRLVTKMREFVTDEVRDANMNVSENLDHEVTISYRPRYRNPIGQAT